MKSFGYKNALTLLFVLIGITFFNKESHAEWNSAGCFLKLNGPLGPRLLLVEDVWSRKLSLPGGLREKSETPEQTAIRETWEETGADAEVETFLVQSKRFRILRCRPGKSALKFFSFEAPGLGIYELRRFLPFHSRLEIRRAILVAPQEITVKAYRFDFQVGLLHELFENGPVTGEYEIVSQRELTPTPDRFESHGLLFIERLQQACSSVICRDFFRVLSFLGEEKFFYIWVPVFWLATPWRWGAELLGLLLVSSFSNNLLKESFQRLRPFEFVSYLQLAPASSYAFPSGHAQVSLVFFGFLFLLTSKLRGFVSPVFLGRMRFLLGFFALGCSASRIFLGVHFPVDVLAGWACGAVCLLLYVKFFFDRTETPLKKLPFSYLMVTFLLLSLAGIFLQPQPGMIALSVITLSATLGVWKGMAARELFFKMPRRAVLIFGQCAASIGMLYILQWFFTHIVSFERTGYGMMFQQICLYSTMGLWLSYGQYKLFTWPVAGWRSGKREF